MPAVCPNCMGLISAVQCLIRRPKAPKKPKYKLAWSPKALVDFVKAPQNFFIQPELGSISALSQ